AAPGGDVETWEFKRSANSRPLFGSAAPSYPRREDDVSLISALRAVSYRRRRIGRTNRAGLMDRWANAVILSWGWRRRGIALAAGALSTLAMPPFFAFPILWPTLPLPVWLIDGAVAETKRGRVRRIRPAFAIGWWFGLGYFVASL